MQGADLPLAACPGSGSGRAAGIAADAPRSPALVASRLRCARYARLSASARGRLALCGWVTRLPLCLSPACRLPRLRLRSGGGHSCRCSSLACARCVAASLCPLRPPLRLHTGQASPLWLGHPSAALSPASRLRLAGFPVCRSVSRSPCAHIRPPSPSGRTAQWWRGVPPAVVSRLPLHTRRSPLARARANYTKYLTN